MSIEFEGSNVSFRQTNGDGGLSEKEKVNDPVARASAAAQLIAAGIRNGDYFLFSGGLENMIRGQQEGEIDECLAIHSGLQGVISGISSRLEPKEREVLIEIINKIDFASLSVD